MGKTKKPPTKKPTRAAKPIRTPRPPSKHPVAPAKVDAVQSVFRRSAMLAEELITDVEKLREAKMALETENASLRTHLAKNSALKELLDKIRMLEREKSLMLSHVQDAEAASTRYSARYGEMEEELSKLANVYIASYQLHSTLRLSRVVRHLKELLQQLVGARAYGIYWAEGPKNLVLIASENIDEKRHGRITPGGDDPASPAVERAYLTGVPSIAEGELPHHGESTPAAVVPMHFDDRVVGIIVVFSVFEQKTRFLPVDFELFKMLGAHAASALTGALLYAAPGAKIPGPEAFRGLDR